MKLKDWIDYLGCRGALRSILYVLIALLIATFVASKLKGQQWFSPFSHFPGQLRLVRDSYYCQTAKCIGIPPCPEPDAINTCWVTVRRPIPASEVLVYRDGHLLRSSAEYDFSWAEDGRAALRLLSVMTSGQNLAVVYLSTDAMESPEAKIFRGMSGRKEPPIIHAPQPPMR